MTDELLAAVVAAEERLSAADTALALAKTTLSNAETERREAHAAHQAACAAHAESIPVETLRPYKATPDGLIRMTDAEVAEILAGQEAARKETADRAKAEADAKAAVDAAFRDAVSAEVARQLAAKG